MFSVVLRSVKICRQILCDKVWQMHTLVCGTVIKGMALDVKLTLMLLSQGWEIKPGIRT